MNKLQASITRKKFMKFQIDQVDHRVLVVGLESAGKSSIVNLIASKETLQSPAPTLGVDMVPFETSSVNAKTVIFYEIGGSVHSRCLLNYYYDCEAVIYVVDSTRPELLQKETEASQQHDTLSMMPTPICTEQNAASSAQSIATAKMVTPMSASLVCCGDDDDNSGSGSDDSDNDMFKADTFIDTATPQPADDEEEEEAVADNTPTMLRNFMSKFEKGAKSQPIPTYADITHLNEEESVEFGTCVDLAHGGDNVDAEHMKVAQNSSKLSKLLGVDSRMHGHGNAADRTSSLNRSHSNPAVLLTQSVSSTVSSAEADRPRNIFVDTFRRRKRDRASAVMGRSRHASSTSTCTSGSPLSTLSVLSVGSSFSSLSFPHMSRTRSSAGGSMLMTEKEHRTYLKQQSVPILSHRSSPNLTARDSKPLLSTSMSAGLGSLCLQPLTMKEAECHSAQELISKVNYELKSSDVPFLIYYNKQDAVDALSPAEITHRLQYHRIINKTRKFEVVSCHASDEARVCEGFAWLLQTLKQIKLKQKEHRAMNELVFRLNAIDQDKYGPKAKAPQCVVCDAPCKHHGKFCTVCGKWYCQRDQLLSMLHRRSGNSKCKECVGQKSIFSKTH